MGIEQFDYLDEQAVAITTLQNKITEDINSALASISLIDLDKMKKEDVLALVETVKTVIGTANAANEQTKVIIAELRPMIFAEKEKIIGDGKTYYNYKCSACSIECEDPDLRFKPSARALKYCKLKDDYSANYKENGGRTIS
jgi:hypothetical protein